MDFGNPGEAVALSICPATKELNTLTIRDDKFENNEIKITEEQAKKIASKYLVKSKATGIAKVTTEIIKPNLLFEEEKGKIYKEIKGMRKVYVVWFNNTDKSRVYIDVTTGEVIGGDFLQGGIF